MIASDVGGPAEILGDGREGLLVAPGKPELWAKAIRTLAGRPERARAVGRAGRDRVRQHFTAAQHAAAVLDVCGEAISSTTKAAGDRGGASR